MIEMVIPSSLDATLAPPGAHVCLLFTQFTPYTLAGGRVWDTMVKEEYAQKVPLGDNFFLYRFTITLNLLFLSMDEPVTTTATTCVNEKKLTLGDIGFG